MTTLQSFDARTGQPLGAALTASSSADIDAAVHAADAAFADWQCSEGATRAALLNALATAIESDREALVALADQESGLGLPRLNSELDRTAFQLRRFAGLAQQGAAFAFTDDPAVAGGPPAGHPAMQRVHVPLGPVAMFSASNFPFAFSVLGGDTASALAAGCSVVVKAHPGHPQTSVRVHALVQAALKALQAAARQRARSIPFYGELGSINPVVATPQALAAGGEALAQTLAGSITLGCGQFCTNPGLLVFQRSEASSAFVAQLVTALHAQQPHVMLTQGMRQALDAGTQQQLAAGAKALVHEPVQSLQPRPFLAEVDAATFIAQAQLHEEVFGPASLIVWSDSVAQTLQVLHAVGGSLTVTLWGLGEATPEHRALVRGASAIAGRLLFAGVPTGVAVTAAQQHGGPWPSSTEPMSTSVGDAALNRFLRPVSLQDMPAWLVARHGQPC